MQTKTKSANLFYIRHLNYWPKRRDLCEHHFPQHTNNQQEHTSKPNIMENGRMRNMWWCPKAVYILEKDHIII